MMFRPLPLAVLLATVAICTPLRAQEHGVSVPYEQFTLDNGLHVILHQDASIPFVTVNLWYHVGSGSERPGRTGFAHLFEHIMYEGSAHAPEGKYDEWLEAAGASNNGSTSPDRTNYYVDAPAGALELSLFLESDRLGYLLEAMSEATVDGQRDVVKNERRQSVENRPYGLAFQTIGEHLYPENHPYHWPTIGYMDDLSAASYQDVADFFRTFYVPNNASLSIAGDIDPSQTRTLVEKWFGEIPAGPVVARPYAPPVRLSSEERVQLEDRVQLPRLYMAWHTPPAFQPGDAEMDVLGEVLAGGKSSRLYRRLVVDLAMAQDVSAMQRSQKLGSAFYLIATARPGFTLAELEAVIQEELDRLRADGPTQDEVDRIVNRHEASFLTRLERSGGFGGKADQMNQYFFATGNPGYFEEDLARYRALQADDIRAAARSHLGDESRVVLSVVPHGRPDLAAPGPSGN